MTKDTAPMIDDDEFDLIEDPPKCKEAQLAEALCDLSQALDRSRSPEAQSIIIRAMDDLAHKLSTPRGELKAIRK